MINAVGWAGRFCRREIQAASSGFKTRAFTAQAMDMEQAVNEHDIVLHDEDIDQASRSLKAISHPLRLKILCTLGDREISVQDLVDFVVARILDHLGVENTLLPRWGG